jgi:hypothetical protein
VTPQHLLRRSGKEVMHENTSAYVSIRQHTSQHTSAYLLCRSGKEVMHENFADVVGQRVYACVHALFPPRHLLHLFFLLIFF